MTKTIQTIDRVGGPQTLRLYRTSNGLYGKPMEKDIASGYAHDRTYLLVRDCNDVFFGVPCDLPAGATLAKDDTGVWVLPRGLNTDPLITAH